MRRSLPGLNFELAAAVNRIGELYHAIPEELRPDVMGERWDELEAEVDQACGSGNRDRALAAIGRWEAHAQRVMVALAPPPASSPLRSVPAHGDTPAHGGAR